MLGIQYGIAFAAALRYCLYDDPAFYFHDRIVFFQPFAALAIHRAPFLQSWLHPDSISALYSREQ